MATSKEPLNSFFQGTNIKKFSLGGTLSKAKKFFVKESGGKRTLDLKRSGFVASGVFVVLVILLAIFTPREDRTFYHKTSQPQPPEPLPSKENAQTGNDTALFKSGQKQFDDTKRAEAEQKRRKVVIKYFASQVIGSDPKAPKTMKLGTKLLGFLLGPVDTREPSLVRVLLPRGGEANGVEITKNSILIGQYSYSGSGEKIFLNFNRLDDPDGNSIRIQAQAFDAADYTVGVRAEVFSDKAIKVVSQIGLSMFAGMTDVLTERESLNGLTTAAKPTFKNGLLQGVSRAAQDQASQTSSDIQSTQAYAILREGKEIIIQLTEDLKR